MSAVATAETDAQLLARLIHTGGKILVVGGGVNDLGSQYKDHPAILLWDDHDQATLSREIPSNVRAILFNRWISHSMVARLNVAAKQIRALKFPMLRTRDIKILLSEIVQDRVIPGAIADTKEFDKLVAKQEQREAAVITQETPKEMASTTTQSGYGRLQSFLAKNINLTIDWSQRGSLSKEGARLYGIAKKEGLETTSASVIQGVGVMVRSLGHTTSYATRTKTPAVKTARVAKTRTEEVTSPKVGRTSKDDFDQLDALLSDAITALQLVQEHMPKVKKETERLRGMKEKMLKMLEE